MEERPKTTRSKKKPEKDSPDYQVKVQQMILDNIEKRNQRKAQQKIDVFNLENNAEVRESPDEGLPQRIIDQIITNVFDKESMKLADRSKLECSICCTDFEDGDQIKILQCLHTHHRKCIDEWFKKKSICPDCKFNLRSLNFQQLV